MTIVLCTTQPRVKAPTKDPERSRSNVPCLCSYTQTEGERGGGDFSAPKVALLSRGEIMLGFKGDDATECNLKCLLGHPLNYDPAK